MDPPQLDLVDTLLICLADLCQRDPLALVAEGHVKVVAMQCVMEGRCTLLEKSNRRGKGWALCLQDSNVVEKLVSLPPHTLYRDIRVIEPVELSIEIKVRSRFTSLQTKDVAKDIEGLRGDNNSLFLLVADSVSYDALRGVVLDMRGRYPDHVFEKLLPDREILQSTPSTISGSFKENRFHVRAVRVDVGKQRGWVVAGVFQAIPSPG